MRLVGKFRKTPAECPTLRYSMYLLAQEGELILGRNANPRLNLTPVCPGPVG